MTVLLDHPTPDFAEFVRVLKGEQLPRRVHPVEIGIDGDILKAINARYGSDPWFEWSGGFEAMPPEPYYQQIVKMFYRLGYDYAPIWAAWAGHPSPIHRITENTAELASGDRHWVEEGYGLIRSWQDFETFPWDAVQPDPRPIEYAAKYLPDGMKLTAATSYFEHLFENLFGFENLSYLLYDAPDLVQATFERWGEKVYAWYKNVIDHPAVGAIFHADDMGFKTSTLLSIKSLRELVLPWHKRFADLAHANGKPFWIHSCGNLFKQGLIDLMIDDVGIDGYHSFQDVILPVADFKAQYGQRVATLGGIDMDKLARLDEPALRAYIQEVLVACLPGGRFALGSGNTIANYVPIDNFVIMLDEGRRWSAN